MVVNTKIFQLSKREADFIKIHFAQYEKNISHTINDSVIKFDMSEYQAFVEELTNLLIAKGLDENDEPNELGIKIERLIDVFNPYYKK